MVCTTGRNESTMKWNGHDEPNKNGREKKNRISKNTTSKQATTTTNEIISIIMIPQSDKIAIEAQQNGAYEICRTTHKFIRRFD